MNEGGTGLGLSIVYGFILQTGGDLRIESQIGRGSTITATLPMSTLDEIAPCVPNGQRALVVEDDQKTRQVVVGILENLGYDAAAFADPVAAIDELSASTFELIISDLELGGTLDGRDVLSSGTFSSPEAIKVLMSGRHHVEGTEAYDFVRKPVTQAKMAALLNS